MQRPGRNCRRAGFTLIEVLVATGVAMAVMTMIATTFIVTLQARDEVDELAESTDAAPRILGLIERDLRGLWTYNVKRNAILRGRTSDVGSFRADRLDLLTSTESISYVLDSDNIQRKPPICEVGYWLRANPKYNDLIELWRREDPMVDDDLTTQGTFQLVCDRIKSFKLTYYRSLGNEAEELNEWDSSVDDELPRRIKLEFILERKRASSNVVNGSEIQDFEGAQKTYVHHFVLDQRIQDVLKAGVAMIPVAPPKPDAQGGGAPGSGQGAGAAGGGPGGRGKGGAAGAAEIAGQMNLQANSKGGNRGGNRGGGPGGGNGGGNGNSGLPPIDIGGLLGGSRGGGNGLGGLFPGGGGGRGGR